MRTIEVEQDDLFRMVILLDAAQEALDAAAKLEERRERGKKLRETTRQLRAERTKEFVAKMDDKYRLGVLDF